MSALRTICTVLLGLTLLVLGPACGQEPAETPQKPPPETKEPVVQEKKLDLPPPVEKKPDLPIEVPDNCDIEVVGEGDRELHQAIVAAREGGKIESEISEDGRTIRIICPDDEEARKNLDVIAQFKNADGTDPDSTKNIVHWRGVNVEATAEDGAAATKLERDEATVGIPEDQSDLALAEWGVTAKQVNPPPPVAKVSVEFLAGPLISARVKLDGNGGSKTYEVRSNLTKKIKPGTYTVKIQSPLDDPNWQDGGQIVIPEGKSSTVKLNRKPPMARVQ